jgi:hypothetical protein
LLSAGPIVHGCVTHVKKPGRALLAGPDGSMAVQWEVSR